MIGMGEIAAIAGIARNRRDLPERIGHSSPSRSSSVGRSEFDLRSHRQEAGCVRTIRDNVAFGGTKYYGGHGSKR